MTKHLNLTVTVVPLHPAESSYSLVIAGFNVDVVDDGDVTALNSEFVQQGPHPANQITKQTDSALFKHMLLFLASLCSHDTFSLILPHEFVYSLLFVYLSSSRLPCNKDP